MSIKVTVSFTDGCYNVSGKYQGENDQTQENIKGIVEIFQVKYKHNRKAMLKDRKELVKIVKSFMKKSSDFEMSEECIDQVDYLMYKALEEWDKLNNYSTNFSDKYLMSIMQKFEVKSENESEEYCRKIRAMDLKKAGIEIIYDIGSLYANKDINFFDKLSYITFANNQQKFMGAKIIARMMNNQKLLFKDISERIIDDEMLKNKEIPDDEEYWLDSDREDELTDRIAEKIKAQKRENEGRTLKRKQIEEYKEKMVKNKKQIEEYKEKIIKAKKQIKVSDEIQKKSEIVDEMVKNTKRVLNKMNSELAIVTEQIDKQNNVSKKESKGQNANMKTYSIQNAESALKKMNDELESLVAQDKKDEPIKKPIVSDVEEQPKVENSTKTKNSKLRRFLNKKFFTRKICDISESIKNKKINIDKSNLRGKVIKGFIVLLATVSITATTYNARNFNNFGNEFGKKSSYETDMSQPAFHGNEMQSEEVIIIDEGKEQSEAMETEAKVEQEQSEAMKTEAKVEQEQSEAMETEAKVEQEKSETMQAETKGEQEKSETMQAETKVEQEQSEAIETEAKVEQEQSETMQAETKAEQEESEVMETETEVEKKEAKDKEEDLEKKLEKFKKDAIVKYMNAFVIGEEPPVGDMLEGRKYYENPDGSGNIGHFDENKKYKVEHILIITPERWITIREDKKSLYELLLENHNAIGYSIHFSNSATKGNVGFITKSQMEEIISEKIDSIIENKKSTVSNYIDFEMQER